MAVNSPITNPDSLKPAITTSLPANKTDYNSNMTVALKNAQPTKAQEDAVDTAGKTALSDYQKQAKTDQGRELLTKALTRNSSAQLSAEQKTNVSQYLDKVANGNAAKPEFEAASSGDAKDLAQGNAGASNPRPALGVQRGREWVRNLRYGTTYVIFQLAYVVFRLALQP